MLDYGNRLEEMNTVTTPSATTGLAAPSKVPILIDGTQYIAPRREMTGAQIRTLPNPPVSEDRDLWLDVRGGLDELINDNEEVQLHPEMRFFTVPKVINPGWAG
jgi:hypothetical protein